MTQDEVEKIIDRVLWMPTPSLDKLSVEVVKNNRREHRYPVHTEARLIGANHGDEQTILVTNISKSGVGISASIPLEVGSISTLIAGTTIISGQVRWCRIKDDNTFEAGILAKRVGLVQ